MDRNPSIGLLNPIRIGFSGQIVNELGYLPDRTLGEQLIRWDAKKWVDGIGEIIRRHVEMFRPAHFECNKEVTRDFSSSFTG